MKLSVAWDQKEFRVKKCKLPEELEISGVQVAIGLRTSLKQCPK